MQSLPKVYAVVLQNTGRRNIGWKYLSSIPQRQYVTLIDYHNIHRGQQTLFQAYSTPDGIVLATNGKLWLSGGSDINQPFVLSNDISDAIKFDINTAQIVNGSSIQIDLSTASPALQQAMATSGSFGFLLVFEEKRFSRII